MRSLYLLSIATITLFITPFTSAIPLTPSTRPEILPQTLSTLFPRATRDPVRVDVSLREKVAGNAIPLLLTEAYGVVTDAIHSLSEDTIISKPPFIWRGQDGLTLVVENKPMRDLTWGMVGQAIKLVAGWMEVNGWGKAEFAIFQDGIRVGTGTIG